MRTFRKIDGHDLARRFEREVYLFIRDRTAGYNGLIGKGLIFQHFRINIQNLFPNLASGWRNHFGCIFGCLHTAFNLRVSDHSGNHQNNCGRHAPLHSLRHIFLVFYLKTLIDT